jgi:hypothetical protein
MTNKCFQRRALCRDDRQSPIPLQLLQKEESTETRKAIVLTYIPGSFFSHLFKLFNTSAVFGSVFFLTDPDPGFSLNAEK